MTHHLLWACPSLGLRAGTDHWSALVDTFAAIARSARGSADRWCTLRCTYCMPPGRAGLDADEQLPRSDELARLMPSRSTMLASTSVRFSPAAAAGAKHLEDVFAATARLRPRPESRDHQLHCGQRARHAQAAGLDRINLTDTVDAARFANITRRDRRMTSGRTRSREGRRLAGPR